MPPTPLLAPIADFECLAHTHNFNGSSREEVRYYNVFCHYRLYNRAINIPENSISSIEWGKQHGLLLHEVNLPISKKVSKMFIVYNKTVNRLTLKAGPWDLLNVP